MPLTFEKPSLFVRRNLERHLSRHLAEVSARPWIGCECKQMFQAIPTFAFAVPPDSAASLRALSPRGWTVPFASEKGFGFVEADTSWRHRGFGTSFGLGARPLVERLQGIDAEDGEKAVRFVRMPNLHVQAIWIADETGDRFFVDYHFAKDPIPETIGIEDFLTFVRGLYDVKQAAYAQARKRALERGEDPRLLCG